MAGKKIGSKTSKSASATSGKGKSSAAGPDDKTRSAFLHALEAKNAKASERSGEDHLNASGMTLHPNDKQQRTHRRKSG